jgi:hypothetical protein
VTRGAITLFMVLVAWSLPEGMQAQTKAVSARAWVDSTDYLLGDPITVHVLVEHPRGAKVEPVLEDTLAGFALLQRLPPTPEGENATATGVVVARYDSGSASVPSLVYFYSVPGAAPDTVSTPPVAIRIHTVPVDTSKAFMDLKPPLSVPWTLAEIALYVGVVLLLAAMGYLAYWYWKRRKRTQRGEVYTPPAKPAHVLAYEELSSLKEKKLWQQGLIKQYYTEVTEVLRRYVERRFSVMALEETTDEILTGLRSKKLDNGVLEETEKILRRADLVKFAKYQPAIPEHEEMMVVVYDVVDKTKVVATTAVAEPQRIGANHVGS